MPLTVNVPLISFTCPVLAKARFVIAVLAGLAVTTRVPPLATWSGATQQVSALIAVPECSVIVPRLASVAAEPRFSGPVPVTVVLPRNVSRTGLLVNDPRFLVSEPLIVVVIVLATSRLP